MCDFFNNDISFTKVVRWKLSCSRHKVSYGHDHSWLNVQNLEVILSSSIIGFFFYWQHDSYIHTWCYSNGATFIFIDRLHWFDWDGKNRKTIESKSEGTIQVQKLPFWSKLSKMFNLYCYINELKNITNAKLYERWCG